MSKEIQRIKDVLGGYELYLSKDKDGVDWDKDFCAEQILRDLISKTSLKKWIEENEADESDGWDMLGKYTCCPGDDAAFGYNKCREDMLKFIKEQK